MTINQLLEQAPLEMIELILMRAFMVFYVHHYKTAIISAGERTYKTLAQVCYLWWQTLDGWPESDTRLWLKHQIVKRVVGEPVNQVTWGIGLCVCLSVCLSVYFCVCVCAAKRSIRQFGR